MFEEKDLPEHILEIIKCFFSHPSYFSFKLEELSKETLKQLNLKLSISYDRLYIETIYKNEEVKVAFIDKRPQELLDKYKTMSIDRGCYSVNTDLSLKEFTKLIETIKAVADKLADEKQIKRLEYFNQMNKFKDEALNIVKKKLGL